MCSIVASWMPSSPELCTATPSPIVSHTPAALMQGRMPPQNVVSSRITSTAPRLDVGRELLEVDDHRVGRDRQRHELLQPLQLRHSPDRVLEIVVAEIEDAAAERDGVRERQRGIRVVAEALARQRRRQRAIARELVRGRIDAALQLVRREAVRRLQRRGLGDELLRRAHFALAGHGIGVPEEEVARELDGIAELAAEERMHGYAELLAHDVEARELDRGVELRAIVVEARRRIADLEAHRLEREHVVAAR